MPQFTASQVGAALATHARDVIPSAWDVRSGAGIARVVGPLSEVPTDVRIVEPGTGAELDGTGDQIQIRLRLSGRVGAEYDISWGRGVGPTSWTVVLSATLSPERENAEIRVPCWRTVISRYSKSMEHAVVTFLTAFQGADARWRAGCVLRLSSGVGTCRTADSFALRPSTALAA